MNSHYFEFDTKKEADAAAKRARSRNKDLTITVRKTRGHFGMKDKWLVVVRL